MELPGAVKVKPDIAELFTRISATAGRLTAAPSGIRKVKLDVAAAVVLVRVSGRGFCTSSGSLLVWELMLATDSLPATDLLLATGSLLATLSLLALGSLLVSDSKLVAVIAETPAATLTSGLSRSEARPTRTGSVSVRSTAFW